MPTARHFKLALLLALSSSVLLAFPNETRLPNPSLVEASRFSVKPVKLSDQTKVVVFYYSASWCGPCKAVSKALRKIYPDLFANNKALELVTHSLDFNPSARTTYLRESKFAWPGINPSVIENRPWLEKISGGTPQFQAFLVDGDHLLAFTEPGDAESVFQEAIATIKSSTDE